MKSILLVEDNADLRDMLRESLESAGYQVITAPGGEVGLTLFRRGPVDAVVTDIMMADGEGIEFIMRIKAAQPETPVIAMSAKATYLENAAKLGADRTLLKPFRLHDLLACLQPAA